MSKQGCGKSGDRTIAAHEIERFRKEKQIREDDVRAGDGSTRYVRFSSDWEAEFCRGAESHERVKAYVKNHNLGLVVPYRLGSEMRRYLPHFILRVDDGHGEDDLLNLIVEVLIECSCGDRVARNRLSVNEGTRRSRHTPCLHVGLAPHPGSVPPSPTVCRSRRCRWHQDRRLPPPAL